MSFARGAALYVMNVDGTNLVNLNVASFRSGGSWSSDGSKMIFSTNRDGNEEIYVMNANGSNQIRLTNNAAFDAEADWKP